MTFARPGGAVPAGSMVLDQGLKRGAAFAAAGVLAALNSQAGRIIYSFQHEQSIDVIERLAGISAIIWFAMYAAMKIGFEEDSEAVGPRDALALGSVLLLCFVPLSIAPKLGLLFCGSYLFATTSSGSTGRRVSLVLLALTGPLIWGPILLELLAGPILSIDAHLVGAVVRSGVDGNVVGFSDGSTKFLIGGPCSSVHNISLAILLWVTGAALFKLRIDRAYLAVGAAMVAWMFLLNVMRLVCIGFFPRNFDYLHSGEGATLFGWAGLLGACLLAGLGVSRATDRQR